ncbi:methyl-accepting chemotaxis protein [Nitrincola alkalilacustris]|uniref:methyl-accepting chemotaxis protein n=1 Tax=Nitrincola alkalilacustris TaxID=1571224 RepID=UPI00124F6C04|nr:methyl-accepting chemotaxis protein [Nitrincola alkalilacustris]
MFKQLSIRRKLVLAMGAALIIALGTSSLFYTRMISNQANRLLLDTAIPAQTESIRNALESAIIGPSTHARAIAEDQFLIHWLEQGEPEAEGQQITQMLQRKRNSASAFTTFAVSAGSGAYWTHEGMSRTLNRSQERDGWFWNSLANPLNPELSADVDVSTGTLTLFFNYKVQNSSGQNIGIAGLGISMEEASRLIQGYRVGEKGRAYLVDPAGMLRIHEDINLVSQNTTLAQHTSRALSEQMLHDDSLTLRSLTRNGEEWLTASLPIESLNWRLIVEIPASEVYAESRQALLMASIFGVVILLIALLATGYIAKRLMQPVQVISLALKDISSGEGDLTRRLDESRGDEIGDLARNFNSFVSTLSVLIRDVRSSNEQLHGMINQVVGTVKDTQNCALDQNRMTDSVATAMHEMSTTVGEITHNATDTANYSQQAAHAAEAADKIVASSLKNTEGMRNQIDAASTSLTSLATDVENIVKVISVIRDISDQTNLLALNAAIEAARAGESGRGFAVVADEVRTLASRTRSSTEDIQARIDQLQSGTSQAVTSMEETLTATVTAVESAHETRDSLKSISEQLSRIVDMNHLIATATEEQSAVTDDVNQNVQGIADVARQASEDLNRCSQACEQMRDLAEELKARLGRFRTD